MNYTTIMVALSLVWMLLNIYTLHRRRHSKLPPGPRPYPIIGSILALGDKPHQSLANLSKTYGPIMSLRLGSVTTVVFSSPSAAQQVLQKHDQVFSTTRSILDAARALGHHSVSIVWTQDVNQFRVLRKLCNSQLFTTQRLDASQDLRRKKVQELLDYVHENCMKGEAVDIGRVAFTTSLNLLSNTLFSIDLAKYSSSSSQAFKDTVWSFMEEHGVPNLADFIPILRIIDPQGVRRRSSKYMGRLLSVFDGIIDQRSEIGEKNDVLDAMIRMTKEAGSELSIHDVKHLLVDLFVAGTDTTSSTVEWAIAELIHNPTLMSKAQAELRQVLDKEKPIEESDISSLPYLQAIVKETLRLHPAAPLLLPHKAGTNIEIDGFFIPKDSRVLVNVWAIGRDPTMWSDPTCFKPERFLDQKIDVKGRDFELLPFGTGRRICPGMPLAHRMVHLMLASLLQHFDWKLDVGMKPEDMDMSEKFGITLAKKEPLRVVPVKVC